MVSNWSSDPRDTRGGDSTKGTTEFTVTNLTVDATLTCDTDADNAIADVLGTLIQQLIQKGIITGTVATH